jgi:hypothetical protein
MVDNIYKVQSTEHLRETLRLTKQAVHARWELAKIGEFYPQPRPHTYVAFGPFALPRTNPSTIL